MLLTAAQTNLTSSEFVVHCGEVFAVFGAETQDSGNVSYGVRVQTERLFVKTAGDPSNARPLLSHRERIALLRNAIALNHAISDAALPLLRNVVEASDGPLLVYQWLDGELLHVSSARRTNPASAFARFRALPAAESVAALDVVFRLHVNLARHGWIASDFYDGCLIYDFEQRRMHVVDLDTYHLGPFTNTMGRMFGSTRFMAPEEHQRGAQIDQRTTVFSLGRSIQQLAPSASDAILRVAAHACEIAPQDRYQSVAQFYQAWADAMKA